MRVDDSRLLMRMVAERCLPSSVDRLGSSEERISRSLAILLASQPLGGVDTSACLSQAYRPTFS
jgi:hypothetical protein